MNEYYQTISSADYQNRFSRNDKVDFSENQITKIKKLIKNNRIKQAAVIVSKQSKGLLFYTNYGNHRVEIQSVQDEWFYINNYPEYYKCDQFDGLIQFLKDKFSI